MIDEKRFAEMEEATNSPFEKIERLPCPPEDSWRLQNKHAVLYPSAL